MSETTTFQVQGMTCIGCENRLGTALSRLDGVQEATADHRAGQVRVRFDPALANQKQIAERIRLAGYDTTNDDINGGEHR